MLLGEVNNNRKQYDIQLKGSGKTLFSRNGDGRSPLGPVIREYILSEAMHTLNIPSTRALAALSQRVKNQDAIKAKHIMEGSNPVYIPRNHLIKRAIQRAYEDDIEYANRLMAVLR